MNLLLFFLVGFSILLLVVTSDSNFYLDITNGITFPQGNGRGVSRSSAAWTDFNLDGRADFLMTEDNGVAPITLLYSLQ